MDTVTHVLSAALWTEPIGDPDLSEGGFHPRWRDRAAVLLGATIMDADGVLGWLSQAVRGDMIWYTKYHRVVTHSIGGLALCALLAAWIARTWPERWLLPSMRPNRPDAVRPSLRRLFGFASIAAAWHFVGDAITHWGTLKPLWPFSQMDVQLDLVNSLSWPLMTITLLSWAAQNQALRVDRRRLGWGIAVLWALLCTAFMAFRPHLMDAPPFS